MSRGFPVGTDAVGALSFRTGAQDVSNALGTSVGSKALTVRQAIVVGAVCEFLGSLVGGEVAATISGGILKLSTFQGGDGDGSDVTDGGSDGVALYAHCMFCTMFGASLWLGVATYYSLPVSTTHSLVGGLIGVGIMAKGVDGIQWGSVGRIGMCLPCSCAATLQSRAHDRCCSVFVGIVSIAGGCDSIRDIFKYLKIHPQAA